MVSASINDSVNDSINKPVEMVNHPQHYNREGGMECLDEMLMIFGRDATMHFCLLNAWKYRYRAGSKNGMQDIAKSDFYIKKYKELLDEKVERFQMDLDAVAKHPVTINGDCGYAMNPDVSKWMSLTNHKAHD